MLVKISIPLITTILFFILTSTLDLWAGSLGWNLVPIMILLGIGYVGLCGALVTEIIVAIYQKEGRIKQWLKVTIMLVLLTLIYWHPIFLY